MAILEQAGTHENGAPREDARPAPEPSQRMNPADGCPRAILPRAPATTSLLPFLYSIVPALGFALVIVATAWAVGRVHRGRNCSAHGRDGFIESDVH